MACCSEYLWGGGEEAASGHDYHASIFHFRCKLITSSSVIMYATERTFVLALALQLEVLIGVGGR